MSQKMVFWDKDPLFWTPDNNSINKRKGERVTEKVKKEILSKHEMRVEEKERKEKRKKEKKKKKRKKKQ